MKASKVPGLVNHGRRRTFEAFNYPPFFMADEMDVRGKLMNGVFFTQKISKKVIDMSVFTAYYRGSF